jgi:hypothetical protein
VYTFLSTGGVESMITPSDSSTKLHLKWKFDDPESGLKEYRFYIEDFYQGQGHKFYPQGQGYVTIPVINNNITIPCYGKRCMLYNNAEHAPPIIVIKT